MVPIGGSHRRSWICIAGIIGIIGFVGLGFMGDGGDPETVTMVKYLIFLTNLSTAFCDVCTDALMTSYAKLQTATGSGDLQSVCWMSYAVGGILSNLFAADLYHFFAPYTGPMFFICALIPGFRIFVAWRLKEVGEARRVSFQELKNNAKKVVATLGHPTINRCIAFIFLANAMIPNVADQQDNFLVTEDNHGWKGTYTNGGVALGTDFGVANGTMDCRWFAANDPGCKGAWMDDLLVPEAALALTTPEEMVIANGKHTQLLPKGWELARPAESCPLSASGSFQRAVESCLDADNADCGVKLGMDGTEFDCAVAGCTYYPAAHAEACTEIMVAVSFNGLSGEELTKACPAIAAVDAERGSSLVNLRRRCGVTIPGGALLRVQDMCPEQCASVMAETPPDACTVPGGYGKSCAATVLTQAWDACPEACQACDQTKRGCTAGAFEDVHAFISQIKIVSNAGHLIGVGLYAAYFKSTKYRKLLLGVSAVVAVIRMTDFSLVNFVQAPPNDDYTVFAIPVPYFAIFGEATQDVIDRILHMPLLVLAAQICPDNIEGTLFAFIMGMSNMGGSYAGEFGSWLTGYMGVTASDFSGLPVALALRFTMTLAPVCLLWMIPDQNPVDVVNEINEKLGGPDEDDTMSDGKGKGEEVGWDFSGWQMLLLLMPPIGLFQIAQPLKNSLGYSQVVLAVPVGLLIAVPAYQHFFKEQGKGFGAGSGDSAGGALSEGLASSAAADDQIVLGGAEPAEPPPPSADGEPSQPPPLTAL